VYSQHPRPGQRPVVELKRVASLFKAVADVLSVLLLDSAPVPRLYFNTEIASELPALNSCQGGVALELQVADSTSSSA